MARGLNFVGIWWDGHRYLLLIGTSAYSYRVLNKRI